MPQASISIEIEENYSQQRKEECQHFLDTSKISGNDTFPAKVQRIRF
jgi:hypothetical protein